MSTIITPLAYLIALALLLLIGMALLAPFESLGWWAGWTKRDLQPSIQLEELNPEVNPAAIYIVYLTAIGGISANLSSREQRFLDRLEAAYPEKVVIIDDVFPFSATNNPLNGERPLAWLWQRLHNSRLGGKASIFATLIFARNLFQVAVSGDPRYGPIYNFGVARELIRSLIHHGYPPNSGIPIAVMGWSGGAQIAVGVAPYLHQALGAPIKIVSIGGVISDDPGLDQVEHLYHIQSTIDQYPRISELLYPGRWRIMRHSHWYRAENGGRISVINPGPMRHTGKGDYLDRNTLLANGQSNLDRTVEVIVAALEQTPIPELTADYTPPASSPEAKQSQT
ncbi:MAG: hypothetical protein ACK2U0_07255 [Candidatus Promineifilaceae bacterium]|jgi:hypothetical protein